MREERREGSPYPKADVTLRALARLVDLGLALVVAMGGHQVGPLVAAVYLLTADGLSHGQSIGKRLFGVRAMVVPRNVPAGYRESILRNAPFALLALFSALPILWLVLFLLGVPILGFEAWRVYNDRQGIRLGDIFADTQVVDAKVISKIEVIATPDLRAASAPRGSSASAMQRATPRPRGPSAA